MADITALDQKNVLAGGGVIYLGATTARRIIGHTRDGISVQVVREFFDVESDQVRAVIRKELSISRVLLKTVMQELDVEKLQLVWNVPAANLDTDSNILTIGIGLVAEQELLAIGPGILSGSPLAPLARSVLATKAVAMEPGELAWSRTEAAGMEIAFEVLFDDTTSAFVKLRDHASTVFSVTASTPTSLGF